jgi:hypothetical protein
VGANGAQAILFDAGYRDEENYVRGGFPAGIVGEGLPRIHVPANWGLFSIAVLCFCAWQMGGFLFALRSARHGGVADKTAEKTRSARFFVRPFLPLSVSREKRDARGHLAVSFAIGALAAMAMLVTLPFLCGSSRYEIGYEPVTRSAALFLTAITLLSIVVSLGLLQTLPARPSLATRLCVLAAVAPPVIVALLFAGLRSEAPQDGLFVARSMALTSRLSPLAPLLFSAGLAYLAALVHLTNVQVDTAWSWIDACWPSSIVSAPGNRARSRRRAAILSASIVALAIFAFLVVKPVSSLEGSFGDALFLVMFVAIAAVVAGALGQFMVLWDELRRHMNGILLRYHGPRITDAMRRLPDALTTAGRPLGPIPNRAAQARCLRGLLDWLDGTWPAFMRWRSQSAMWPCLEPAIDRRQPLDAVTEEVSLTLTEARRRSEAVEPTLQWFWSAPPCAWPTCGESSKEGDAAGAFAWLLKAEELVAACEAMPIYPMLGHLQALLVLAVGGSLLCGLALASYAFQPERLLATIFSLIVMAALVVAFVALLAVERNRVLSALTKTEPKISWTSFLARTFVWVGLPLLAFLALQYPVATNHVASWLDPFARLVR